MITAVIKRTKPRSMLIQSIFIVYSIFLQSGEDAINDRDIAFIGSIVVSKYEVLRFEFSFSLMKRRGKDDVL